METESEGGNKGKKLRVKGGKTAEYTVNSGISRKEMLICFAESSP